jgi:hypothetical protein
MGDCDCRRVELGPIAGGLWWNAEALGAPCAFLYRRRVSLLGIVANTVRVMAERMSPALPTKETNERKQEKEEKSEGECD